MFQNLWNSLSRIKFWIEYYFEVWKIPSGIFTRPVNWICTLPLILVQKQQQNWVMAPIPPQPIMVTPFVVVVYPSADKSEERPIALCIYSTCDESLLPLSRFPFTEGQRSTSFVQNCFLPGKLALHTQTLLGYVSHTWHYDNISILFSGLVLLFLVLCFMQTWFIAAKVHSSDRPNNEWTMGNKKWYGIN